MQIPSAIECVRLKFSKVKKTQSKLWDLIEVLSLDCIIYMNILVKTLHNCETILKYFEQFYLISTYFIWAYWF